MLKRVDFDTVVDHLALTHIIKSKSEPATNRIERLLEVLSSYTFDLYYLKGKVWFLFSYQGWKEIRVTIMRLFPYHLIPTPA